MLIFDSRNTSQRSWNRAVFVTVASSLLLTTVCNHLGTEILENIDKANTSKYKLQFLNDDFIYQEKRGIHTYLPPQWNNLCHSWQQ